MANAFGGGGSSGWGRMRRYAEQLLIEVSGERWVRIYGSEWVDRPLGSSPAHMQPIRAPSKEDKQLTCTAHRPAVVITYHGHTGVTYAKGSEVWDMSWRNHDKKKE